jgi:hypothetical protein
MVGTQALCFPQIFNEAERTDPATLVGSASKFGGASTGFPARSGGSPLTLVSSTGHKAAAFAVQTLLTKLMKRIVARPQRRSCSAPTPSGYFDLDRCSDPDRSVDS